MATLAARTLRVISFTEGLSYIALMFVAMPLKHFADMPIATRIAGSVHGLLFVLFAMALAWTYWSDRRASGALLGKVFTASVVPFGMIWADRQLHSELLAEPAPALAPATASSRADA